jgi:hypothetical protein
MIDTPGAGRNVRHRQGRSYFANAALRRLAQVSHTWEADFLSMPSFGEALEEAWVGMVVSDTDDHLLAQHITAKPPTAAELAELLTLAMGQPLMDHPGRPERLHVRSKPQWSELKPELKSLGIELDVRPNLPKWDAAFRELSSLADELLPRKLSWSSSSAIQKAFPALARWDRRCGRIELDHQEGGRFVARAFFHGGLVFEDVAARNLLEAIVALEQGIAAWMKKEGVELNATQ